MTMPTDDQTLLAGIRAGKRNWAAVYEAYREPMLRGACRIFAMGEKIEDSRVGESAEDAVHAVMLPLIEGKTVVPDHVTSLRDYLVGCAIHKAVDAYRKTLRKRQDELGAYTDARFAPLEGALDESLVDAGVDVAAIAEQHVF